MHQTHVVSLGARVYRRLNTEAHTLTEGWKIRTHFEHLKPVPTYWARDYRNFGDRLTAWLLPHYGIFPKFSPPSGASLIGVGSVLSNVPPDFAGTLWGSGLIRDEVHPLEHAKVLAVRGQLTADRIGASGDPILGDPGLLVSRHVSRPSFPPNWKIGLVPHKIHQSNPVWNEIVRRYPAEIRIIDVTKPPLSVARSILDCSSVISSSLHGVIVADSFNIPAAWALLDPPLAGGDFKFRDHETALDADPRKVDIDAHSKIRQLIGLPSPASRSKVIKAMDGLESSIGHFERSIA